MLREYFAKSEPFTVTLDDRGKPVLTPNKLPTLERFAIDVGADPDTLTNWGKANPEFLRAINEAKAMQRDMLMQGGLMGSYKDTIVKLILSTNHGMHEKNATDLKHEGGVNVTIQGF